MTVSERVAKVCGARITETFRVFHIRNGTRIPVADYFDTEQEACIAAMKLLRYFPDETYEVRPAVMWLH